MNRSRLVLVAVLMASLASAAWGRTWTDNQGNQIKAKFVRVHEGNVVLSMGRRVITVPFGNFSREDRNYIREQLKAKGQEHLVPQESQTDGLLPGLERVGSAGDEEGPASDAGSGQPASGAGEIRTWTDVRGRTIKARFVGVSGGLVVLLKDGQRVSYPWAGFSPMDRQYVRDQLEARGAGHLIPEDEYGLGMEGEPMDMPGAGPRSSFPGPPGLRAPGMPRMPSGVAGGMAGPGSPGPPPGFRAPGMPGYRPGSVGPGSPPGYGGPREEYASSPEGPDDEDPSEDPPGLPGYRPPRIPTPTIPTPTIPRLPGPLSGSSGGFPDHLSPEMAEYGECGNCGKRVPAHLGAGDRCPHCGVVWEVEELADGTLIDAKGRKVSRVWYTLGGAGGMVALFVGVIFLLARLAASRQ